MRGKKFLSVLCVAAILMSQSAVVTFSTADSSELPTSVSEKGERISVTINNFDSGQSQEIKKYIRNNIVINKVYDGNSKADIDLSGLVLTGINVGDEVTLKANAEFDKKDVGKRTLTLSNFRLEGKDSRNYTLVIPENFSVDITNAEINKKEIRVTPINNIYDVNVISNPNVDCTYNEEDIIVGDTITESPVLTIVKNKDEYIYKLTKDNTGNENYKFVLADNVENPSIENPIIIPTIIVSKTDQNQTLNKKGKCLYSNGSVKIQVSAQMLSSVASDKMTFNLSVLNNEYEKEVIAAKKNENNITTYTAEFEIPLEKEESKTIENLNCKISYYDNNELKEKEETLSEFTLSGNGDVSNKLVLDNTPPELENEDDVKVRYNVETEENDGNFHNVRVTGKISDFSGVEKVEYQWDNNDEEKYTECADIIDSEEGTEFEFLTSYDSLPELSENEKGIHTLYLKITDNAGNLSYPIGTYCDEKDGMDTKAPEITSADIHIEEESNWFKDIINIIDVFNILPVKEKTEITFTVQDTSESDCVSGVKSVVIKYNKDNSEQTELLPIKDSQCTFEVPDKSELKDIKIELTDNFNNGKGTFLNLNDISTTASGKQGEIEDWEQISKDISSDKENPTVELGGFKEVFGLSDESFTIKFSDNVGLKKIKITQINSRNNQKTTIYDKNFIEEKSLKQQINLSELRTDTCPIELSELGTGTYCYSIEVEDLAGNIRPQQDIECVVDHNTPKGELSVDIATEINGHHWIKECVGNDGKKQEISLGLKACNNGSEFTEFIFNINGKEQKVDAKDIKSNEDGSKNVSFIINPEVYPTDNYNMYNISCDMKTESGNSNQANYELHVDKENPKVNSFSVKNSNNPIEKIINVLTFGVFCKDSLELTVNVSDGEYDAGLKSIKISYLKDGETEDKEIICDDMKKEYDWQISLDEDTEIFQSNITVVVVDQFGKTSSACPYVNNVVGKDGIENHKNFVMVENIPPEVDIDMPTGVSVDKKIWFDGSDKNIDVTLQDVNSGICQVEAFINDNSLMSDKNGNEMLTAMITSKKTERITEKVFYQFSMNELVEIAHNYDTNKNDGEYTFKVQVVDNAGNVSEEKEVKFYRDITPPEITKFQFQPKSANGKDKTDEMFNIDESKDIIKKDYGYYFKEEFKVKVVAQDEKASSKLKNAAMKLYSYTENKYVQESQQKMNDSSASEFTIPKGFKGMIFAQVCDNVGNISHWETPDAFVHDEDKPVITIKPTNTAGTELPRTAFRDSQGYRLYKDNISFTVTISDIKSGLKSIVYAENSFAKNYTKSLVTEINNNKLEADGNRRYNIGDEIGDSGWIVKSVDLNVITQVEKTFTYGKNGDDKNIFVNFEAFDNADNNRKKETEKFTIDRVAPEVTRIDFSVKSVDGDKNITEFIDKLEYGYYFKEPFVITANCKDDEPSSGLKKADFVFATYKNGKKISEKIETVNMESNRTASCNVPDNFKGQIFFKAYDNAENTNPLKTINAFVIDNKEPEIIISPLPTTAKTDDFGNKLYTDKVEFKVTITDMQSGLRELSYSKSSDTDSFSAKKTTIDNVNKDYKKGKDLNNGWKIEEMDNNLVTKVSQVFVFDKDDKNIFLAFNATDRSKNQSNPKESEKFTIDTVAPVIEKFNFEPASVDDISEVTDFIEELEYGYYFKKEFNAIVTSGDNTPSSGLYQIQYRLMKYENGEFSSEEIHQVLIENGRAVYTVPAGFKGQIYAKAFDRAENISEEETPQGMVVDEEKPKIDIPELQSSDKEDGAKNKLYTSEVKFTVTITDEKSGLREIVYSKDSENDSYGDIVTTISNSGYAENSERENGWKITKMDRNLVTQVSKEFVFDKDDNDIEMKFSATDRSKNQNTERSEKFTIDMTAPVVEITYPEPTNGKYYKGSVTFNMKITERNFDASCMLTEIEDTYKGNNPTINYTSSGLSTHSATVTFEEGDYNFRYSGTDKGNNKASIYDNGSQNALSLFSKDFNVDGTVPVVKTNFKEFESGNGYFSEIQTAKIEIVEHNFYSSDMGIIVKRKVAGSDHDDDEWSNSESYFNDWKDDNSVPDKHTLSIELKEDAVYRIIVKPQDRAGNMVEKAETSSIFEIDTTAPQLIKRNNISKDDENFIESPYYEVYDEKRKNDSPPSVEFEDANFERIEIKATVYKPEYTNKTDIINIKRDKNSDKLSKPIYKNSFTLGKDFDSDGVYVVQYVAYDKAGNSCKEIDDTYFKMINTDVLAYIDNSTQNKEEKVYTGYYSLMDENGRAISKKASDFEDMDINVITQKDDKDSGTVIIRDEKEEYTTNEYATVSDTQISKTSVIRKTHLTGAYFSETFKDDSLDTRMYLSVSYKNNYYDLATIHIDNEKPTAKLPEDFVSWHNYMFTDEVVIQVTEISEMLDENLCKVYECPRQGARTEIPFNYSEEEKILSFKLNKGLHNIDIILSDEAGNEWNIDRVKYLRIGNFRLYLGIGIFLGIVGIIIAIVLWRKKRR